MAHVVGVPRRDPCRKCQLPVFLAERLLVGKKVYHRTCLKCARCGSQLSPGSFYETEVDDQYCCETCPDEEIAKMPPSDLPLGAGGGEAEVSDVQMRSSAFERDALRSPSSLGSPNARSVRSSIKDRLAFFEQQQQTRTDPLPEVETKVLQKSLSDEEKSKSLQRMENAAPTYKMNPALTSFLHDTVDNEPEDNDDDDDDDDEEDDEDESGSSLAASLPNPKMETSDSEVTEGMTASPQPPELPTTLPPTEHLEHAEIKTDPPNRYTASAHLVLGNHSVTEAENPADEQDNNLRSSSPQSLPALQAKSTDTSSNSWETSDRDNNNSFQDDDDNKNAVVAPMETEITATVGATPSAQKRTEIKHQVELEYILESKTTNDNDCVTKEKATVEASQEAKTVATTQLESTTIASDLEGASTKSRLLPAEIPTNDTSEHNVELRTKSLEGGSTKAGALSAEDKETTERLSVVRARLQQFEVITNNELDTNKSANKDDGSASKEHLPMPAAEMQPADDSIADSRPTYEQTQNQTHSMGSDETYIPMETENVAEAKQKTETENPTSNAIDTDCKSLKEHKQEVPLTLDTKDNEKDEDNTLESKSIEELETKKELPPASSASNETLKAVKITSNTSVQEYPEDLNPFQSDDDNEADGNKENEVELRKTPSSASKNNNLNPFDSSDDEIELEKMKASQRISTMSSTPKIPPPRPPPPRISKNPFGSEDEDESLENFQRRSSLTSSQNKRTPVPTPRSNVSQSQNPTPEPTPRLTAKSHLNLNSAQKHSAIASATATSPQSSSYVLQNSSDFYGSANSLQSNHTTPNNLLRNSETRSSNNSLNLSAGGTIRSRKSRRAPLPPAPVKELFPSNETINSGSKASTPSSSTVGTPKSGRKKRPAPAPPKPARLGDAPMPVPQIQVESMETPPKNLHSYPLQSELDSKLSDEEKALLEGKTLQSSLQNTDSDITLSPSSRRCSKRIIPLDKDLIEEHGQLSQCDDLKQQQNSLQLKSLQQQEGEEANVVYRRLLMPLNIDTPVHEVNPLIEQLNESPAMGERQLEKLKDNKEANNRNRQSQISAASSGNEDNDPLFNKSVQGKWKRRKGPAPALPIPPRKVLQMLPLQEIKHELEIIEVQQQGLEKQGVILEKMIRDRCEGENGEPLNAEGEVATNKGDTATDGPASVVENSKEVEYLILQLFELVNEKNELFRRQAELMYLRRQHRLEQEQANLEYEIRVLMAQPERNKTDSDKAREEDLIERLVKVVQLRNEVIECLEMDRLREAEEDQSIKQRLESHIAQREDGTDTKKSLPAKLSKKEKKKQKEAKKLGKSKKMDADKDADESELSLDKQKTKKKKKLLIF